MNTIDTTSIPRSDEDAAAVVYDFLRGLPVLNPKNFSRRDVSFVKIRPHFECDVPLRPDEKRILQERVPLILEDLFNHWTVHPIRQDKTTRRGQKREHERDGASLKSAERDDDDETPATRRRIEAANASDASSTRGHDTPAIR